KRFLTAYPEIDFSLFIDGEKTMDLRKNTRDVRIKELFGHQKVSHFIPVMKKVPGISVEGFVSQPGEGRKSREEQFFFLNRRAIVNRSLTHSVLSAYGPRLRNNEYPSYILYLEMDPRQFDVNVHPIKIEVRFLDEKYVHDVIQKAILEVLRTSVAVPKLHLISGSQKGRAISKSPFSTSEDRGQLTLEVQRPHFGEKVIRFHGQIEEMPSLWQLHNRYILSQIKSGLTIIDQHVAHERILYEKVLAVRSQNSVLAQQLLFPQTITISHEDFLVLTEIFPFLEKIGFGLKEFGKNTIVIEAVPTDIRSGREKELLQEIIEEYKETKTVTDDPWDTVVKAFACKSAIKSGDRLTLQEMASLIDQLFATQDPYSCPHGRPVVINLSLEEIDKRFGR
ncbi:hypothetical protein MUP95_10620, partial [bacterium]|nr:hypothetical protein [bacterium]